MNYAPSTSTCRAVRPLDHRHDHPSSRRRLRSSCCVAALAAVALAVPSDAGQGSRAAAPGPSVAVPAPSAPVLGGTARGAVGPTERALASVGPATLSRRVCVAVANVRSGPGLGYRVMTTVGRGTVVRGTTSHGWLRIRTGRWISLSVTCAPGSGTPAVKAATSTFRAWARAIDPAGNAQWSIDYGRTHTRGNVRGLTVFRGSGPTRSTVYIQPGMTWAKTKIVMAHEATHVRQVRYRGFAHSLRVFGSVNGLERAADCGATLVLGQVVRGGCPGSMATRVRRLLAGHPA